MMHKKMTVNTAVPSMIRPLNTVTAIQQKNLGYDKENDKKSIRLLTLASAFALVLLLCLCLLVMLVFVGKNLTTTVSNDDDNSLSSRLTRTIKLNNKSIIWTHVGDNSTENNQREYIFVPGGNKVNLLTKLKNSDTSSSVISEVRALNDFLNITAESQISDKVIKINNKKVNLKVLVNMTGGISKIIEKLTYRLPNEIKPKLYELFLHPNLNKQTFSGRVAIHVEVIKPISYIALHTKNLTITETKLYKILDEAKKEKVSVRNTFEYIPYEYWITETEKELQKGAYSLNLEFHGSLANRIVGFYGSQYFDKKTNVTRKIATSKFEPTYARQAFPCFDEPAMKAPFKISLVHPNADGYHALSNMDVLEEQEFPGNSELAITVFNESVPMSTYLACFIVSDFVHDNFTVNNPIGDNFKIRVFATPAQLDKIEFAGKTGAGIIEFYLKYFNISYPLPKLDMAAIPDFVSGAMEHWGLVTYRETALLYNESISSTTNKQRVAAVVAHELAHMWFGNLVTMKWWNELWLNEGFASYIEYKGVQELYPQWGMMDQFLIDDLHPVLILDATLGSHPIVQTVENPDQITEIFDTITYSKGSSVIRMLENFVGDRLFQTAVENYLNANKYGNAETTDLMNEIDKLEPENVDVTEVVNTWIRQKGYPYLTIAKGTEANTYTVEQKRFLIDPDSYDKETSEYMFKWDIPLTYITDTKSEPTLEWYKRSDNNYKITIDSPHSWVKFNKDQIGYYRVNYPSDMWKTFTDALVGDVNAFSISDRTNFLDDSFNLAEAQIINYGIPMDLTRYLKNEREYVPWSTAASKLNKIKNLVVSTDINEKFREYVIGLVDDVYNYVGWDIIANDENHIRNLARTTVLDLACGMGHEGCLKKVGELFTEWISSPDNRPHPDIRNIVYFHGMYSVGDSKSWEIMWNVYADEQDASEKLKLMYGLSAIKDPIKLMKFIQLAVDRTDVIRSQDFFTLLQYVAANKVGEPLVWDFVRDKWTYLEARFTLTDRYLGQMVKSVTSRFATELKLEEMRTFFAKYPNAGAGTTSRVQALETVTNNINWLERNKEAISIWLDANASKKKMN